jgi:hypothetical protein
MLSVAVGASVVRPGIHWVAPGVDCMDYRTSGVEEFIPV